MRRWIPASVAALALSAAPAFLAPTLQAQINGVPSSVTSPGFGGHAVNGTPASVTSLGPRGITPAQNQRVTFGTVPVLPPPQNNHHGHPHHRNDWNSIGTYYAVPVAVPYPVETQEVADENPEDADDQPGPTIFDRHGARGAEYIPPREAPVAYKQPEGAPDPASETPADPTTLVFKGGRELEVTNYAIVGQTLYDLTPGHQRKVALAELDLNATQKLNDDRGVSFQLPPRTEAN